MPHSENLEVVNSGCNRDGHGDSESESVYTYYSVLSTQYSVLPPLQDRDCRNLKVTVMYDAVLSVFAEIEARTSLERHGSLARLTASATIDPRVHHYSSYLLRFLVLSCLPISCSLLQV